MKITIETGYIDLVTGTCLAEIETFCVDIEKEKFGDRPRHFPTRYAAAKNADALLICTEWSIFRTPNFDTLKENLKNPVIFDGRNLYAVEEMKHEGFEYTSIGRKKQ